MSSYAIFANIALGIATYISLRRPWFLVAGLLIAPSIAALLGIIGVIPNRFSCIFATLQGFTWWGCLHLPIGLLGLAIKQRYLSAFVLAMTFAGIGVWATEIEPFRLEVRHFSIASDKAKMRIALITDIQTDHVGAYEQHVFDVLRTEYPDLILFAGDYIQVTTNTQYVQQTAALAKTIGALTPPLGAFAVRGDVDGEAWELGFMDTNVHVLKQSQTLIQKQRDGRPFYLTALSVVDSRSSEPPLVALPAMHIVLGHAPDYALAAEGAHPDLMLAGHTHGGQIQIPFFGPLVIASLVPRNWGDGLTTMYWGGSLIVSRGVGMERLEAPRVRLFCRPEITIIDMG